MAAGDDGNWYEMGCFNDAVVLDIIPALEAVAADKLPGIERVRINVV
jgi:hypothetical protein